MPEPLVLQFSRPGLLTTVQDAGRFGYQDKGVPFGGYLDRKSANLANQLVGNAPEASVLEMTLIGPAFTINQECQVALTGAKMSAKANGEALARYRTHTLPAGSLVEIERAVSGCRGYLAIRGQWQLSEWLDSTSAFRVGRTVFPQGSLIQKGTQLFILKNNPVLHRQIPPRRQPDWIDKKVIRVLPGPEFEQFSRRAIACFFSQEHRISRDSSRMGCRLESQMTDYTVTAPMISSAVLPGTVQVVASGMPVILLADAQTVGGYPRFLQVIAEDLDILAQRQPGEMVQLVMANSDQSVVSG